MDSVALPRPSSPLSTTDHLPGLDGLRGSLVLGILAYHLGYAPGMFVTVDGFFVLSGFLITGLLLRRPPTGGADLRRWWARRLRRLLPAVAVTVVAVVVVFRDTPGIARDGLATMTWWANWNQVIGGATYWSPEPSPLRHAWTLSIEEQFYFAWPLVVAAVVALSRRIARRIGRQPRGGVASVGVASVGVAVVGVVLGVASFAWAAWLATTTDDLNRVYLGTDTRVGAILLGCAAAALVHGRPRRPATPAATGLGIGAFVTLLALASTLTITGRGTYTGGLALATAASVALVVVAARPGPVATVLSARPLQWLGVRSYGIYLWSWPLQILVERTWPHAPRPAIAAATVAGSFALGALSLRLVETPLRGATGWASALAPRRAAWSAGAAVLVVALVGVSLGAPEPPAHQAVSEEESAAIALEAARAAARAAGEAPLTSTTEAPPTTGTTSTAEPSTAPPVTTPPSTTGATSTTAPPQRPLRVVSAGDSQAYTAAQPTLTRAELPDYIESVTVAGVLGCGILVRAPGWTMIDPDRGGRVPGDYCLDSAEVAEVTALQSHPDWMVVFSGGFERPFSYEAPDGRVLPARHPEIRAAVVEQLSARVERARAAGVRTALVEWACPGIEVGDEFLQDGTRWHNAILRQVAAAIPGTITIPPSTEVCVDADPTGRPTPDKERAWGYEVHPVDRAWLWNVQIGPALHAAS